MPTRAPSRLLIASALAAALLLTGRSGLADGGRIGRLGSADRARLEAGRIVLRPVVRRSGERKLFGGASWQVIDRPVEEVWAALLDVERYDQMLPEVRRVRVVARDGARRIVRIEHGNALIHVGYHVRLEPRREHRELLFRLDRDRPSDLQAAWGFIRLRPWGSSRTLVSFGAMADVGSGLVSGALRPLVHEWMLKVPWTLKKYLERGRGRTRYRLGTARQSAGARHPL